MLSLSHWNDQTHYCCHECGVEIPKEDFEVNNMIIWRCPTCNGPIDVYASTEERNYSIIRKYASEIKINDLIFIVPRMKSHEVFDVKEIKGMIHVALKEQGVVKLAKDAFVDSVMGRWPTGTTPWTRP
ncbi:hypothetical protein [Clostridium estertheticum]|uniref:hypothetical protein n=1 Tax=Clostridium estertheticum TaxID=238834 RepID=UPI001C0D44FB|nr:hypothetical protein [Clostridium estertheticum]MBU3072535.1 hypothetical protein [Clostridium estertheticum]MBU3162628.1 hypothetical protein [Clostridium estertheticum]